MTGTYLKIRLGQYIDLPCNARTLLSRYMLVLIHMNRHGMGRRVEYFSRMTDFISDYKPGLPVLIPPIKNKQNVGQITIIASPCHIYSFIVARDSIVAIALSVCVHAAHMHVYGVVYASGSRHHHQHQHTPELGAGCSYSSCSTWTVLLTV